MAHKLPIVATNVAAIPDFVTNGENGFLVSPGDIQGLTEGLVRVLSSPELCRQMGERSHAVSQTYTWDNSAAIMREVIQRFVRVQDCPARAGSFADGGGEAFIGTASPADIDS
jgi:glycosyltransferase involved in cell wall biosynthesis